MSKIVCIGISKTGTTSVKVACRKLGYSVMGWSDRAARLYVDGEYGKLFENYIQHYDVFTDFPWSCMYRTFDELYPDSKFILTHRDDNDAWYESLWNHVQSTGHYDNYRLQYGNIPIEDKERLIEFKNNRYLELFNLALYQDKNNVLDLNLFNGDGWPELCGFLDKSIPGEPFPHVNKAEEHHDK